MRSSSTLIFLRRSVPATRVLSHQEDTRMDGMQTVHMTMKEVMAFFRRSRPQIDRYRQKPDFPKPIGLSETDHGALLFLRSEVLDYAKSRPRRTLRPPADSV